MALPGEFTFRAYKNGKIDLLQAEALNSLIQANSKYQAQMAFHNLEGKLSQEVQAVRQCLLELSAQVETVIDFQEDQQLDPFPRQDQLDKAIARLDAILSKNRFNEALAQGLNVVIAGKVNTGKSTLFNALLMEERAIISAVPGTTRDYLTEKIYIAGYPVEVTDMAGIQQQTGNDIEGQGIQRSLHKIEQSDAVLFVVDGTQALDQSDFEIFNLMVSKNKLIVINKTDIATPSQVEAIAGLFSTENVCAVSAKERIHIDQILVFLKTLLETYHEQSADLAINLRQKTLLERLRQSMQQIAAMLPSRWPQIEMTAEEIRQALSLIGELSGEVTRNDVLKEIFKTFCIGK